jgi:hypothetical protein
MYSSGTPIFVPNLFPNSYYNTRYAIAIVPLIAFAAAAMVASAPPRLRLPAAIVIAAVPLIFWRNQTPICWKESEVNSVARRAWTAQAAQFLAENYHPGDGILFPFGDLTGALREAGIPLREGVHEGNGPLWLASITRPDLFLRQGWVLGFAGDDATTAALRADRRGRRYVLRKRIIVKGAPVVELYQRQ